MREYESIFLYLNKINKNYKYKKSNDININYYKRH